MTEEETNGAKEQATPIPDEDWRMVFSGPAPIVNRMYANNTPSGVRLTFAEQFGDIVKPVFRCAVTLNYDDAVALRGLLDRQLAAVARFEMELGRDGVPVPKTK